MRIHNIRLNNVPVVQYYHKDYHINNTHGVNVLERERDMFKVIRSKCDPGSHLPHNSEFTITNATIIIGHNVHAHSIGISKVS